MKGVIKVFGIFVVFMMVFGQLMAQERKEEQGVQVQPIKQPIKAKQMTISQSVVRKPIKFEELPAPVQEAYKNRFKNTSKVREVYYVKEGGREIYRVSTLNEANSLLEIDFDATGKIVREEKKAGGEKSNRSTE